MLLRFALIGCACGVAACSPKPAETADPGAPPAAGASTVADVIDTLADPDAPPADGRERFYGREKFTIVYEQSGIETGQVTEHVRDYGRSRAEIAKTTLKAAGMTIEKDTRLVYDGAKVTTIDNATGSVTTMTNPMYDGIVAAMKGKTAMEFGEQMMGAMGGEKTGEKGSFAGEDCDYWAMSQMSVRSCVAPWGASLFTSSSMGGMSFERKAIEVRMGDAGPAEAFAFDASKATEGPDLDALMKNLPGRN